MSTAEDWEYMIPLEKTCSNTSMEFNLDKLDPREGDPSQSGTISIRSEESLKRGGYWQIKPIVL